MKPNRTGLPTILLDLNFTLAVPYTSRSGPFARWVVEQEQYRGWLVELLRPRHVVIMTGRPGKYAGPTIQSLLAKTRTLPRGSWLPDAAFFNCTPDKNGKIGYGPTARAKKGYLEDYLYDLLGDPGEPLASGAPRYVALESSPWTRNMYAAQGIKAVPIPRGAVWNALPV